MSQHFAIVSGHGDQQFVFVTKLTAVLNAESALTAICD